MEVEQTKFFSIYSNRSFSQSALDACDKDTLETIEMAKEDPNRIMKIES